MSEVKKSPFRDPITNVRYTKALFWENCGADKSTVLYTLKDQDHDGYPSMYRLYMEIDDPTEWKVAQQLMDGWEHWEMLCKCTWFKPFIERWRKELELRYRSKALERIRSEAKSSGRDALFANKYILEKGWEPREKGPGRGRPSKDEIKKAADEMAKNSTHLSEDFERLGLAN